MDYSHTKFRISARVAEFIKLAGFSPATVKLFFALIFLQDQTEEGWPPIHVASKPQDHFVMVKHLRQLGFPSKTRSSRFLRKPVAELSAFPEFFDHIEIAPTGRFLTWRVSESFFDLMAEMDVYGLIDASEIELCTGKYGGALLAQIPLHRKKRLPQFRLLGPNKGYEDQCAYVPRKLVLSENKRDLCPQLQNWANKTEITFAVMLVQESSLPGYTDVLIRMRHKGTEWPEERFTKRPATACILTISPDKKAKAKEDEAISPGGPAFF